MNSPVSPRRLPSPSPAEVPRRRSRRWWWVAAAVLVVVAGVGAALFEPWRLFTRSSIDEAAPAAAATPAAVSTSLVTTVVATPPTGPATPTSTPSSSIAPATTSDPEPTAPPSTPEPFVDGEHATSGTAAVVSGADGRRYVRLENFSTSDGPDVHVILSDRSSGQADWGVYDDGRHVELGELKATDGNQNYEIPADVDLAGLRSVVVWCDRFDVAFGTAALAA